MGVDRPIDVTEDQRKTILTLLKRHLPNTIAWVYGSRVKWSVRPQSVLDLVVFAKPGQERRVSELREAFEESNLPFRVDLFVWDDVPKQFRKQIEAEHVVLVEREEQGVQSWREVKLGELGEVNRGRSRHRPRNATELYGGPYPFVQTGDIKASGGKITSHTQTYNEVGLAQSRLWPANTMVITIAANIAETAILTYPACFPDSVVGFVAEESKCDVRFVEYMFRHLRSKIKRENVGTGSVQDNINLQILDELRFLVPSSSEQRAIAHVLGTLDDKIELNRRTNETLEAMARALFKSWFIDFDPVRAKIALRNHSPLERELAKQGHSPQPEGPSPQQPAPDSSVSATPPKGWSDWTVDRARAYLDRLDRDIVNLFPDRLVGSELRSIPEGWEVKALGECYILIMGQSPPGSTYNEHGEGLPFFQGRTDFGFRYPKNRKYCTAPTRVAEPGDTLVSVRAPVGDINMAWEKCCIGRGVASLRHKTSAASYSYYFTGTIQSALREYEQTGTVFGAINKNQFDTLRVLEPDSTIVNAFDSYIRHLDEKIRSSIAESLSLATLCDALLPQLVSGKLRIGDVDNFLDGEGS